MVGISSNTSLYMLFDMLPQTQRVEDFKKVNFDLMTITLR